MQMDSGPATMWEEKGTSIIPRGTLTGLGVLVPPRHRIEKQLVEIWERILKVEPIGVEDHWFDLGGDSLSAAVLFAEIEAVFCKTLALSLLLEADTVATLAALIERPAVHSEAAPIFNAKGKLPPLYCAHGLTGTAAFARRLAEQLGPEQPVMGFQALYAPGEVVPDDVLPALAGDYLEIMRRHRRRGPYHLIGWCVGSLIAFEMAQRLLREDQQVARLILVDPPVRQRQTDLSEVKAAARHLRNIDVDPALRNAMIRTLGAIGRGGRSYKLAPYPGEVVILCSEENLDWFTANDSEWRIAAKRLVVGKVAPTHMAIVFGNMPRLAIHVQYLLQSYKPARVAAGMSF